MPPKKQTVKTEIEYKPFYVLPIFAQGHSSRSSSALSKPINIKKNIDTAFMIQFLKSKGQQQLIQNDIISAQGRKYICQNIALVAQQLITVINKPVDPKKDAKKDNKKDPKKQQVQVENPIPPIEYTFEKNCNDFIFLLGAPTSPEQLDIMLSTDIQIDVVVLIEEKIKPGTQKPRYDLLHNDRSFQQITNVLQNTQADRDSALKAQEQLKHRKDSKKSVEKIKAYRSSLPREHRNKNLTIINVPYLDNLLKPEENEGAFLQKLFIRLCKLTKQLQTFHQWKQSKNPIKMVQPIRQTVIKKVQVQEKPEKGKKNKNAEPVFQEIEQVVETNYQDFPQNIRSDLADYKKVKEIKKLSDSNRVRKDNQSIYKQILNTCLHCFSQNNQNPDPIEKRLLQLEQNNKGKVINKVGIQNIAKNLRTISYFQNISYDYQLKFTFPTIESTYTFMDYAKKWKGDKQKLRIEYLISKLQSLAKQSNSRLQWNFSDRVYLQLMSKEQIQSVINQQLFYNPQIITGYLQSEGLKLVIMSRINPPGRILHHNIRFPWKVLPDFENFLSNFANNKQLLENNDFFDYPFEKVGNLSVNTRFMMPTDNTVIREEILSRGTTKQYLGRLDKGAHTLGIVQEGHGGILYSHVIHGNVIRVQGNNNKGDKGDKGENKGDEEKKEGQQGKEGQVLEEQEDAVEIDLKDNKDKQLTVFIEFRDSYSIKFDPNPTIFWKQGLERIRKFGARGEITCFRKDGQIHIYKPNGDISIYRNGRWNRVEGYLHLPQIVDGEKSIRIRQDQTIFVEQKGNKKIIFPDGTQIFHSNNGLRLEIKNKNGPFIRIHLPKENKNNVIGYGSAFAYLGFQDLLQRSYDDYMFEVIDEEISSHSYLQVYERDGTIYHENVRLICHKDSSIFKICETSKKIVYVSPTPNSLLTEEVLNERWLQAFSEQGSHGEGVFWVDLEQGFIYNKDSQGNKFKVKAKQPSEAEIAVSFIKSDDKDKNEDLPNGFYVEEQNYFLPLPNNRIPPRLFCISQDGSGIQFLNKQQIGQMKEWTVIQQFEAGRTVCQYTKQVKRRQGYLNSTFSIPVNLEPFGLPNVLSSFQTNNELLPPSFSDIKHRVIREVVWDSSYSNLRKIEEQLNMRTIKKNRSS